MLAEGEVSDAEVISAAVQANAMAAKAGNASNAVRDSYSRLKGLLASKGVDVEALENAPESMARAAVLTEHIERQISGGSTMHEARDLAEGVISSANNHRSSSSSQGGSEVLPHSRRSADERKADLTPLRGALKLEVSTSTPTISAGKEFSIYVVIRNPFPVPVIVTSTETHIPIELSDEIWRDQRDASDRTIFENTLAKSGSSPATKSLRRTFFLATGLRRRIFREAGPRIAVAVSPHTYEEIRRIAAPVVAAENCTAGGDIVISDVIHHKYDLHFSGYTDDEVKGLVETIRNQSDDRSSVLLNPGDSVVQHFMLRTTKWLLFTPIGHTFQIQVRYRMDAASHVDTAPFSLSLRSALASSLIGSMAGSIGAVADVVGMLGGVVSDLFNES